MPTPVTRQEVQSIADTLQNRLCQKVATHQDFMNMYETLRTMMSLLQQNQQLLRQAEFQRLQSSRRVVAVETRLAQMEQELRAHRSMLEDVQSQRSKHVLVPAPTGQPDRTQYMYRPA
jgi:hypothetical protein